MTATTVEITPVTGNELFRHYRGQTSPQSCYVSLDCRSGKLSAAYNPEIGNAVTTAEYHGHIRSWSIPCLRETPANALLEQIEPLAERVVVGYRNEWNGSNHVAAFDEDALEAIDKIAVLCEGVDASEGVRAWDAGDWLTASGNTRREVVCQELGITAETTDEEIAAIESRVEEEARATGEADVLTGTAAYLRGLRDEAPAAPVGGWTPCGDLAYGTVEALREDDEVRISYTTGQDLYADDDTEIRAAVEAALGVWIETPSGEWSAAEGDGEVVQTVALLDEQPTHEIVFTDARGEVTTTRVHLLDGVAYTRQEMETMDSADWEVSAAGEWRCQGQVTPGGASGTVEIRTLRPETVN